jgi:phage terminase large subunit-like protein
VAYKAIRASRGKHTRAEPVAAIFEQGRGHNVGMFPEMEDQLCSWVPGDKSPDRLDAKVWAYTELMLDAPPSWASVHGLGQVEGFESRWT